ncbi:histidine utilization repressor [Desulforhopalus sp. IMCC35007]|uniref:histidine utilization repressor n=1 Tax=Desulforhopalus sp. IMCC35007 TaxID=2569543 RepID=UPI0010AE6731|nr:histidine utilization repressor [Desulforhopalus sp. IMCC35007]TKB05851.1 histidine utilization repressor [Desulforhopalus sp. IMCC35007]
MKTSRTNNSAIENIPRYQQVKDYILDRINSGAWQPGMKIDTEAELVTATGVSRMTVNRALRELTVEGRLTRIQGSGTFVAEKKPQSALFEIHSIAQEIRKRGGKYSCEIHTLQEEKARPNLARAMLLAPYTTIYHSIIVHKDNGVPIQLSSRFINPKIAPDYLKQDFTTITPNEYLLSLAPITSVEHVIEALIAEPWIRHILEINSSEPCLALHRKTWVGEVIATCSTFYYPGSRYTLGGHFTPPSAGSIGIS